MLKEKETEEKHLDDEMNGAADTDPRIKKQAGAVSGSPAAADPEMMEVDIKELEGPPRRPIFGFHNPTNYCHGIASLVAVRHALYCLGLCAEQEQLMPASCSDLKTGLRCIQLFARSEYPLHLQDDYDGSMNIDIQFLMDPQRAEVYSS